MVKHNYNQRHLAVLTIFASILLFSMQPLLAKSEVLKLEIQDGELILKTPSKCPQTTVRPGYPENGCVRAPKRDTLTLEFRLSGDTKCSSDGRYQLSGVQLAGKGSSVKPTAEDWGATPLDQVVQNDFDVADAQSGWLNVSYAEHKNNQRKMYIEDANQSLVGYVIWYRVRATCSDPQNPDELFYDPRIDNLGSPPN